MGKFRQAQIYNFDYIQYFQVLITLSIGENKENRHSHTLLGVEIGNATWKGNVVVYTKILNNYDLALSHSTLEKHMYYYTRVTYKMFSTHTHTLFKIRENWEIRRKLLKCPKSD